MIKRPPYEEALGIATGDVVQLRGSGPYYVWAISGPRYTERGVSYFVVWPFPVISLVLVYSIDGFPLELPNDYHFAYVHDVYLRSDERWFSGADEVFVTRLRGEVGQQMNLFAAIQELPAPYEFQPGVEYHGGDGTVWKCERCGADFNATKTEPCNPKHCGRVSLLLLVMGDWADHRSVLQRWLGIKPGDVV